MPNTTKNRPSNKVLNSLKFDLPGKYDPLNTASKPPLELTYSFDPAAIAKLDVGYSGWSAFSNAQKEAVRDALAEYATFINVRFVENTGGSDIDLAFGRTSLGSDGLGGIQWRAGTGFFDLDGYTIFDTSEPLTDAYGQHLMLHEIGHGMTLKHPGNYGGDEGPFLNKSKENSKYSVMSYRDNPDSGERADHLMLYDIAALQSRFGANLDYRTGDDVYTGPDGRLEVIWDAGGTDTIDGSGYGSGLKIDLRDGRFTSLGQKDNFAIAYGAVIENAKGGSGNDKLTGNKWANALDGGTGNDVLDGGKGADRLTGGPGSDTFLFKARPGSGRDAIADFAPGVDTIRLDQDAYKGIGGKGALAASKFHIGSDAHDRSDRIIYDDEAGLLIHDRNGSDPGKAKVFAAIDPGLDIEAGIFIVT
jgi:serralysin